MSIDRTMMMEAFCELHKQVRYPVYGGCTAKRFLPSASDLRFGFMAFTDDSFVCLRLARFFAIVDAVIEIPLSDLEVLRMKKGWLCHHILIRDKRTRQKMELCIYKKPKAGDFVEQMENREKVWKYFEVLRNNS